MMWQVPKLPTVVTTTVIDVGLTTFTAPAVHFPLPLARAKFVPLAPVMKLVPVTVTVVVVFLLRVLGAAVVGFVTMGAGPGVTVNELLVAPVKDPLVAVSVKAAGPPRFSESVLNVAIPDTADPETGVEPLERSTATTVFVPNARLTVAVLLTTLPPRSCTWTLKSSIATPAVRFAGWTKNTSFAAGPVLTLMTVEVALVNPAEEATNV